MSLAGPDVVFAIILLALVVIITVIDLRRLVIPDWLNLLLLGTGLAALYYSGPPARILYALAVAAIIYGLFWLIRLFYQRRTGQTGLGLGDVKMLAAGSVWVDGLLFPVLLLVASMSALLYVGAVALIGQRIGLKTAIPFGPFIGLAICVTYILDKSGLATPFAF